MKLRMPGIIVVLWQAIRAWFDYDVRRLGASLALLALLLWWANAAPTHSQPSTGARQYSS